MSDSGAELLIILLTLVSVAFYFLPFMVALMRGKKRLGVFMVNLFFGWSVIGWVAAFIWACVAT